MFARGVFWRVSRHSFLLYDHKGEKERAIADYRAAMTRNPSSEDRKDLEDALQRLGAGH